MARFEDALPFEHLTRVASKLLSPNGLFSVVIPFKEENRLTSLAQEVTLFPTRILRTKGNSKSKIKRSLLEFSFKKKDTIPVPNETELVIENGRHNYTEDYINLTKDFYLKM